MKTQIVYSVISTEKDFFLEELWVSVYSLRQFHPNDRVVVMPRQEKELNVVLP